MKRCAALLRCLWICQRIAQIGLRWWSPLSASRRKATQAGQNCYVAHAFVPVLEATLREAAPTKNDSRAAQHVAPLLGAMRKSCEKQRWARRLYRPPRWLRSLRAALLAAQLLALLAKSFTWPPPQQARAQPQTTPSSARRWGSLPRKRLLLASPH